MAFPFFQFATISSMSDTKTTLLASLPLLFIVTTLIAALIILPKTDLDIRDKAAEPRISSPSSLLPTPTPNLAPDYQLEPETACTALYDPVCGIDNQTYPNGCEALKKGVRIAYNTACTSPSSSRPTFFNRSATPTPTLSNLPSAY